MSAPTRRSGGLPRARSTPPSDAPLRGVLTGFLWDFAKEIDAPPPANQRSREGMKRRRIRQVNAAGERLLRAVKAAVREQVRQLPGRAQKGALQAALNTVTPKVRKALT
jgi:hypothetical protein